MRPLSRPAVFGSADGAVSVARLPGGAVVLAERTRSVVELDEAGALAMEVLFDCPVPLPASLRGAARVAHPGEVRLERDASGVLVAGTTSVRQVDEI